MLVDFAVRLEALLLLERNQRFSGAWPEDSIGRAPRGFRSFRATKFQEPELATRNSRGVQITELGLTDVQLRVPLSPRRAEQIIPGKRPTAHQWRRDRPYPWNKFPISSLFLNFAGTRSSS